MFNSFLLFLLFISSLPLLSWAEIQEVERQMTCSYSTCKSCLMDLSCVWCLDPTRNSENGTDPRFGQEIQAKDINEDQQPRSIAQDTALEEAARQTTTGSCKPRRFCSKSVISLSSCPCPSDCNSPNGICLNGVCTCRGYWTGADCSVLAETSTTSSDSSHSSDSLSSTETALIIVFSVVFVIVCAFFAFSLFRTHYMRRGRGLLSPEAENQSQSPESERELEERHREREELEDYLRSKDPTSTFAVPPTASFYDRPDFPPPYESTEGHRLNTNDEQNEDNDNDSTPGSRRIYPDEPPPPFSSRPSSFSTPNDNINSRSRQDPLDENILFQ